MVKLFGYLNNSGKIAITSKIGEFLKKYVGKVDYGNGDGWIATPSELNKLDRMELAKEFKGAYPEYILIKDKNILACFDNSTLIQDIAMEIDRLIPQRYFMVSETRKGVNKDVAQRRSKGISIKRIPELFYHFNHNTKESINKNPIPLKDNIEKIKSTSINDTNLATAKQLKYLDFLCDELGYFSLKSKERLLKKEASQIIDFIKNNKKLKKEIQNTYLEIIEATSENIYISEQQFDFLKCLCEKSGYYLKGKGQILYSDSIKIISSLGRNTKSAKQIKEVFLIKIKKQKQVNSIYVTEDQLKKIECACKDKGYILKGKEYMLYSDAIKIIDFLERNARINELIRESYLEKE